MLKAITTVTILTIVLVYFILLSLTYPSVCWFKHRPTEENDHPQPPSIKFISKRSAKFCLKHYALHLMPMPSKIIMSNEAKTVRIPSTIRIETKQPLPFPTFNSSENAPFTLSIIGEFDLINQTIYPYLGINESYQLNITSDNRALLVAKTYVGVIRGLATFQQLQAQELIPTPLTIVDQPRFIWRGLMLDVARHFIPISIIQQTIDFMKLVKMNVLHLHLTDDQGFRMESKQFPLLHDSSEFYSQSDVRDLIEYARLRAIRIVPEFDMPAHTASWFVGYPHLSSSQKSSYQLETMWGIHNATMDATRQGTYDFLDQFFGEMTQIFRDQYFHIGGDECAPHEWLSSEPIKKFMQDNKLYSHQNLQGYFTKRVEKLLEKYNRTMMGWDEISSVDLSRQSLIQSWRSQMSLIDAAHRGYYAILSHGFYLDHMSPASYHYSNNLHFDTVLNKKNQEYILGGEACLWTEYINADMAHSRLWPRTAAIAERLWSSSYDQIDCMYDRLNQLDKKFFHPNDQQYIQSLAKLASNVTALKLLADLCEPLGLHGRNQKRNYTSRTNLNRFVDLLRPESKQTRKLIKVNKLSLLYSTFLSWKMNKIYIDSNATEILQLSENLLQLGEIGIRLLKLFNEDRQRPLVSSRWYSYQLYLLNALEYQVPEIRLAGVRVVKDLLEEIDYCTFDLFNLSLLLFFPLIILIAQRVSIIRRRLLIPCLLFCFHKCARC
ncbi:unnamed protein product [Adineta ricciae]|uniref:beta-N-acetylhexosaminidase n=1 Tax=Adineta ricciae TaxID=249248 RepID=A0A814WEZ1_ADIRI|nr:unnamed protein product [Adineta ricciae]